MQNQSTTDELIQHILSGRADELSVRARLGNDLNLPNSAGMTPAKAAVMNASYSVLRLLFANGASANQELLDFANQRYPHKPYMKAVIVEAIMRKVIEVSRTNQTPPQPQVPPRRRRTLEL